MERFPLLWQGKTCGELTAEREGLYTRFSACARLPEGIRCAWIVGEQGELRLGIPEPQQGGVWGISRRVSNAAAAPLGRILRCEVRKAGECAPTWQPEPEPERLFASPFLRQGVQGRSGVLSCRSGGNLLLAFPWEKAAPFPLAPLFCLARLLCIGSRYYIVYAFDGQERPVMQNIEKI